MFLTLGHRATGSNEKEKKERAKRKAERAAKRAAIVYKLEKRERERIDKALQKSERAEQRKTVKRNSKSEEPQYSAERDASQISRLTWENPNSAPFHSYIAESVWKWFSSDPRINLSKRSVCVDGDFDFPLPGNVSTIAKAMVTASLGLDALSVSHRQETANPAQDEEIGKTPRKGKNKKKKDNKYCRIM